MQLPDTGYLNTVFFCFTAFIITFSFCFKFLKDLHSIISPLPERLDYMVQAAEPSRMADPTPTPTERPQTTLEGVVAYIAKTFEPEGKAVVVEAINCFSSESRLNPDAVNVNANGQGSDHGIAQVNDYWHSLSEDEKTNYHKNIDRAYKIYKQYDVVVLIKVDTDTWAAEGNLQV